MVLDAVSNFVRGETDAAVDSTQTTISVVDASIFPDPSTDGEYNVVIWDAPTYPRPDQDPNVEVLRVTAIDTGTNDLTVTRGQEGTAGASHPSESAVHLSPTAKMFGDIESTFGDFWNETTQELTADVNNQSVNTDTLNSINYFPPVRLDTANNEELNTATPATSYTDVTLTSLPSDASIAIIKLISGGNGGSTDHILRVRENGTTRTSDVEARGWAGHGDNDAVAIGFCPVDENNIIEYNSENSSLAVIRVGGYL